MTTDLMSIMDLLDRPIAYQRSFVRLGGGVLGAVLMSQAVYWSRRTTHAGGWFYKSQAEWEEETGLKRSEQEKARKALTATGVLEEVRKGAPAKLYFRVNEKQLISMLVADTMNMTIDEVVSIFQSSLKGLSRGGYLNATKRKIDGEYVDYAKVLKTHGMFCACCGNNIELGLGKNPDNLSFDYVLSPIDGGTHIETNLRPAHVKCVKNIGDYSTDLNDENRAIKNVGDRHTGMSELDKLDCRNPTDITENTAEITAETTTDIISDAEISAPAAELLPAVLSEQKQPKPKKNTKPPSVTTPIWEAYKNAYYTRYQTEPVRNAKVNSQIKQLWQRLGDEAGPVAEFYVLNVSSRYVIENMHDLGSLLAKAEAYRTQWATGRAATAYAGKQQALEDRNRAAADQFLNGDNW